MLSLNRWKKIFIESCNMLNLQTAWTKLLKQLSNLLKISFLFLIASYRTLGTAHLGGACRFQPSCSDYAQQALNQLPIYQALVVIVKRILRCRPGGSFGFDPVPQPHQCRGCHG